MPNISLVEIFLKTLNFDGSLFRSTYFLTMQTYVQESLAELSSN